MSPQSNGQTAAGGHFPKRKHEGPTMHVKILTSFCVKTINKNHNDILSISVTGEPRGRGLPLLGSCLTRKRRIQAADDARGGNETASLLTEYT